MAAFGIENLGGKEFRVCRFIRKVDRDNWIAKKPRSRYIRSRKRS